MAAAAPVALAMAAVGSIVGGIEQNRAARAGARADTENARRTILLGEQEALQTSLDQRRNAGDMLAAMAGSGFEMGNGSFGDLLRENAYQQELEILNIRTMRAQEADGLLAQAAERRKSGRAALVGGMFGAVSNALQGASSIRSASQQRFQLRTERAAVLGGVPPMRVGG
ncbi:hypothetical protein ACFQ15_05770 [Sphingomonas hankookensis]|uniref:hypothetical protein n=1 Tax=Sphingomonas hankookensis TaxID=563996 RepID=UPI001F58CE98|nr:hypothetical protein [Sphingomonas hankookensis]